MRFYKYLHTFQSQAFDIFTYASLVLYILVALGLSASAPQYLTIIQYYLKLYISIFLIWRFNPFRHVRFTKLDATIAFNAGIFLLATLLIGSLSTDMNTVLGVFRT